MADKGGVVLLVNVAVFISISEASPELLKSAELMQTNPKTVELMQSVWYVS